MPAQEREDNVVAQLEELEALEAIYEGGCEIIGRDANSAASATDDCCPEVCRLFPTKGLASHMVVLLQTKAAACTATIHSHRI